MSKPTPGPWCRVSQTQGGDLIAREYETGKQMNPKGLRMVAFMLSRGSSLAEDEANARLIAAAPELLEALRTMANLIDAPYFDTKRKYQIRDIALAAIAKAEGA